MVDCVQNSENEEHVNNSDLDSVASSSAELMVMSELCIIQNKLKVSKLSLKIIIITITT